MSSLFDVGFTHVKICCWHAPILMEMPEFTQVLNTAHQPPAAAHATAETRPFFFSRVTAAACAISTQQQTADCPLHVRHSYKYGLGHVCITYAWKATSAV